METCIAVVADSFWMFVPSLFMLAAFGFLFLEATRHKEGVPAVGPAPRLPGESLRLGLDDLNEKLVLRLLVTVTVALLTGMVVKEMARPGNFITTYGVTATGSAVALSLALWTWEIVRAWRERNLGLEGERMVGRELNLLMLDGCRVFHDLVDRQVGNIDHIIVAEHAVFVVETRMLRKRGTSTQEKEHRVLYNGSELQFPGFCTSKPLQQTERNARWLEEYLRQKIGVQVPVNPILTLPGWWVRQTGEGKVTVVNSKQIGYVVVDKAATPLPGALRQSIINLLDDKCRYSPA